MPIQTVEQTDYAEFIVSGEVDADEIIDHIRRHFSMNDHRCALWNMTEADLSTLSARRFEDIVVAAKSGQGKRRLDARTAIVVSSRPDLMLVKAFTVRAEVKSRFPVQVFESHPEAIDWLLQG